MDWIKAHPFSYRDSNDWLTWNLNRCGAAEAPSDAFFRMDADKKPASALKDISYQVWQLLLRE